MISRRRRELEIAEVLARHGMAHVLDAVGLGGLVSIERRVRMHRGQGEPRATPEDVRLALVELGPTFIKLGQLVSTRPDLVSPEYQRELTKLQDADPPVPADVIQSIIERELNRSLDTAFATFDLEPLAAASIGQAHAATLHDGAEVVVKIRRPNAVEDVHADLEIIHDLAVHASHHWEAAARFDAVGLADHFAQTLRAELDYRREAANAERFAANFAGDPEVQIPRVFRELSTSQVITLERVTGLKISDLAALDAAGIDRRALAARATRIAAKMVFEDGFFHADPHPGNFFIEPGGRIGIIDFGRVGSLDAALREHLEVLLIALLREDPDRLATALASLGVSSETLIRHRLRGDLASLMAETSGKALGEVPIGSRMRQVLAVARRNSLTFPPDLMMLLSVIVMEEGMAVNLDPAFRLTETLTPYIRHLLFAQFSPAALAQRLEGVDLDLAALIAELPDQLHRLLDVVGRGGFQVELRTHDLEPLVARAERLGNRIAVSVLAGALIDALAEVAGARDGRRPRSLARRWSGLGVLAALGGWMALSRSPAAMKPAETAHHRAVPFSVATAPRGHRRQGVRANGRQHSMPS